MLQRTSLSLLLLAGFAIGAATGASAQGSAPPAGTGMSSASGAMADGTRGTSRVARADATFVREAAAGGQAEITLGELASQKAASPRVKQFGQQMVADHTATNRELMQIASGKGLTESAEPTPQQKRDATMLGNLSGQEFDRAYARQMVADHRKTITLFERQAKSGRDAELKAFAAGKLPALREHLQMARALGTETTSGRAATTSMPMQK
jgi:putative membrane protein